MPGADGTSLAAGAYRMRAVEASTFSSLGSLVNIRRNAVPLLTWLMAVHFRPA